MSKGKLCTNFIVFKDTELLSQAAVLPNSKRAVSNQITSYYFLKILKNKRTIKEFTKLNFK